MRTCRSADGPFALLLLIALATVATAGCGGGGEDTSRATSTTATGTTANLPGPRHHRARRAEGAEVPAPTAPRASPRESTPRDPGARDLGATEAKAASHRAPVAPLKVSGAGSSRFEVEGGDNSVQEYGEEAGGSELRRAAGTVHAFFVARARGEWALGCALLSPRTAAGLEGPAGNASGSRGSGCPAALALLTEALSPSRARELTAIDAASLRTEGKQAFLLYTGPPGGTVYAMPLVDHEGLWKLGAIEGAVLPGT